MVGATIFPLVDIARQVGGDQVEVVQIIPTGASEHSLALSPEQLRELQGVRTIFQVGHNLDTTLTQKITRSLTDISLKTVDQDITLREFTVEHEEDQHHDKGVDPHFWLTVPNAQKIAATIAEELSRLDSAHASVYEANLTQYTARLTTLEAELQQTATQAPQKNFIAMHNAWGYFADHYGFELVATYEPVEGREPSIADLSRLGEVIEQYAIKIFYSEPQKNSTSTVRFLQKEFDLEIRTLDPVGGIPPYDSYENLMRANMRALTN